KEKRPSGMVKPDGRASCRRSLPPEGCPHAATTRLRLRLRRTERLRWILRREGGGKGDAERSEEDPEEQTQLAGDHAAGNGGGEPEQAQKEQDLHSVLGFVQAMRTRRTKPGAASLPMAREPPHRTRHTENI